ncbi:putative phenylacetyl-CoA ligase [Thamnocephalis sphaerospora]|uniref:Putative phenylacetyl-CoA ligase n=1 Tax=Thamnocephalis sphaerospora TaxID=78915 RepID=A0A4P9XSA6_9FUNG|nr:putative phenylacetyl-CoA ligase [Thamnocephalis sphaerospora]|eukprot:RKP08852.1 putative phenylacetyl-CoA ligase [Thamnocephalis sphaerospora]
MVIYRSPLANVPAVEEDLYHYLFESTDKPADNAVMYVDPDSRVSCTFGSLRTQVRCFADALRSKFGARRGDVIAFILPNSMEFPLLLFGAIAAGLTVTAVNPAYPADDAVHQLQDSDARFLVADHATMEASLHIASAANIPEDRVLMVGAPMEKEEHQHGWKALDVFMEGARANTPARLPRCELKTTAAVICYTSGTTGKSKGAMITHSNIVNRLECYKQFDCPYYARFSQPLVQISYLPFYHIFGVVTGILMPFQRRSPVVIMRQYQLERLLSLTQEYRVQLLYVVPPICVSLATSPLVDKYDLSCLREIISASAPLAQELIDTVHRRLNIDVRQQYGMTEMTMMTHATLPEQSNQANVGVLMANTEAKLIDSEGRELPAGATGELCIRSTGNIIGYRNNPEATAATIDTDGYIHTGDIASVDEQGRFQIVDRIKEVIKYKGFQVAPTELEDLLCTHEAVSDAVVVPVEQPLQGTELPKALVVLNANYVGKIDPQDLAQYIADRVVAYKKLRGGVEFIDAIPYSPAGKKLRRVLRERENSPIGIASGVAMGNSTA